MELYWNYERGLLRDDIIGYSWLADLVGTWDAIENGRQLGRVRFQAEMQVVEKAVRIAGR